MEPLAPELEKPRARVDRRVLLLCGTASIALAASAVIVVRASPAGRDVPVVVPMPIVIASPPQAIEAAPPDVAPGPEVSRDQCPAVPSAYGEHAGDADAPDLAVFVARWLSDPDAPAPAIEYRRGVVFVESEEDRGDDGPYPRSAAPEARRVCGSAAAWLRSHLHDQLARRDRLVCDGTRCCYSGMEYAPEGTIVFRAIDRDGQKTWALVAWTQTYSAGLAESYAVANARFVDRAEARLAKTSCPGEPDGAY